MITNIPVDIPRPGKIDCENLRVHSYRDIWMQITDFFIHYHIILKNPFFEIVSGTELPLKLNGTKHHSLNSTGSLYF